MRTMAGRTRTGFSSLDFLEIYLNFSVTFRSVGNGATGKQVRGAYPQNMIEATPPSWEPRSLTGRAHGAVGHDAE